MLASCAGESLCRSDDDARCGWLPWSRLYRVVLGMPDLDEVCLMEAPVLMASMALTISAYQVAVAHAHTSSDAFNVSLGVFDVQV